MEPPVAFAHLPPFVAADAAYTFAEALPRPLEDTPENRRRRDKAAMAQLALLRPADAIEAMLAMQYVLVMAHAACAMQDAVRRPDDALAPRLHRQALSLQRTAQANLSKLKQRQAARVKLAAQEARQLGHAPKPVAPVARRRVPLPAATEPPAERSPVRFRVIEGGRTS